MSWDAGDSGDDLTQKVSVSITDDTVDEADETFTLTLTTATNAFLPAVKTATGTIDDDDDPLVGTGAASAGEGDGTLDFEVTLDASPAEAVTVEYTVGGGTATAGTDYTVPYSGTEGSLSWDAGDSGDDLTQKVSVSITDDTVDEADETFTLTLTTATNAFLPAVKTATGTIDDDDDPLVGTGAASAGEGAGTLDFEVTLDASPAEAVTVNYTVGGGTATAGTDYTVPYSGTEGSLSWDAGDSGDDLTQKVSVSITDDTVDEADETFTLTLTTATNASLPAVKTATGTIDDDDDPLVGTGAASAGEGAGTLDFEVTLDASPAEAVTVNYTVGGGTATAGTDYTVPYSGTEGSLSWDAGDSGDDLTQKVSVSITDDTVDEADETFTLTLTTATNASLPAVKTATGTIDDDDDPLVGTGAASAGEGDGTLDFEVTLDASPAEAVTVNYTVSSESGDTATAGVDYTATSSGSLTILAGATSGTISVPINDDALEEDAETFTLTLTTATNASLPVALADKTAKGTIEDDDPLVGTGNASAVEDEGSVDFTVSLNTSPAEQVTVNYTVGGGTATAGEDYRVPYEDTMGTLTIEVGEMRGTISVPINDDTVDEADETFTLTLMSAKNAFLAAEPADNTATGMIVDDDRTVTSSWFASECVAGLAVG